LKYLNNNNEPLKITGKDSSAVLVDEEDRRSIQETQYLSSIPGMRESIIEGMNTPVTELDEKLDW
jgi:antitoxin YefM